MLRPLLGAIALTVIATPAQANPGQAMGYETNEKNARGSDAMVYRNDGPPTVRRIFAAQNGLLQGCPKGLAEKRNGCKAPGLDKASLERFDPSFFGLDGARDRKYVYDEGYLLRLSGDNAISGYIPLLGGALALGNVWPSEYQMTPLPDYYAQYYALGQPERYRYADNVIYRIDPETAAITSVAAMLTGDDFTIGQPIPAGYDVYNVPMQYRDRYRDTDQAMYRYADGYVYRVDRKTSIISAAIDLLV